MTIRYCEGYGWHVGRPIQWIFLMLGGIPFALIMVLLEAIQKAATHVTIPLSLIAPLVYLWLLRRRLKRKFGGEPFAICLPEFFMEDMTTLLICRGHRHFRALVMLEMLLWGSVVATQLGIICASYVR